MAFIFLKRESEILSDGKSYFQIQYDSVFSEKSLLRMPLNFVL